MTPRIGFLLVRHPAERKSPIMPEVFEQLRARGATVEARYPEEEVVDLSRLEPAHDLTVLKSGSDLALSLAGALASRGATVLNPYPVAAALRDKILTTRRLQAAGVPVPETWVTTDGESLAPLLADGPLVVKPYRGSQGRGVRMVREAGELAGERGEGSLVFAQRFHQPDSVDRKIYCIGGEVFGVLRAWPPQTYEDKLGEPFPVAPEMRAIVQRCGEAFGIDLFGVDIVISEGRPWVVDMQAFPGFKGVPEAARRLADYLWAAAGRAQAAASSRTPLARELELATRLAREAGEVLRRHHGRPLDIARKLGGEPVTRADLESNAVIVDGLRLAFPDDAIFSEESPDTGERLGRRRVWIVDPLDATSNYLDGGDEAAVSIGLAVDGRPALGVVCNPFRDELVAGADGVGVTLNGRPVRVSACGDLARARLHVSRKEWGRGLRERMPEALPVEPVASMAYKLARVAAGLADGAFSLKPRKEWGTCAGAALVRAAGGRVTLLDGSEPGFNRTEPRQPMGMVAAGLALHPALLEAIRALEQEALR
jgi:fructose-1,6-bisphosphatase/inositol monophosphatase family enzyme/glutathione synthase/RimK-type ligase-like ATP-grasp enzyme